jgi:hypothetical protein
MTSSRAPPTRSLPVLMGARSTCDSAILSLRAMLRPARSSRHASMMTPMAGGRCRSAHDLISLSQNKRALRLPPGSTGRSSPKPATRRPGFRRRTAHRSLRNGGMGASRAADTPDTRSPSACRARLGRQPGSGLLYFLPLGRYEKIGGEPHPLTLPVSQSFSTR